MAAQSRVSRTTRLFNPRPSRGRRSTAVHLRLDAPRRIRPEIAEAVRVTVEAIRHTYAALPDARNPVDDLLRISGLASVANGAVGGVGKFKRWRADKKRLRSAIREAKALGYMLVVEKYEWKEAGDSFRYHAEAAPFHRPLEPIFLCNGMTPGFAAQGGVKALRAHLEEEAAATVEDSRAARRGGVAIRPLVATDG